MSMLACLLFLRSTKSSGLHHTNRTSYFWNLWSESLLPLPLPLGLYTWNSSMEIQTLLWGMMSFWLLSFFDYFFKRAKIFSVSMPAPGSHYSRWKLSNVLLFKQKSECVVQLQPYETNMVGWHGAIHSCLVKKQAFGKAGREKGVGSILARHEARVKRPLKNMWGIEKRKDQEDGLRWTEVWWEVWTKICRDLVWPGGVSTLLRPWILQRKSEVHWGALPLEGHFTFPALRFPPFPPSIPAHQISINRIVKGRGKRKIGYAVAERWGHGTWVKRLHDSMWFRGKGWDNFSSLQMIWHCYVLSSKCRDMILGMRYRTCSTQPAWQNHCQVEINVAQSNYINPSALVFSC